MAHEVTALPGANGAVLPPVPAIHLLLVDDDPAFRTACSLALQELGITPVLARSATTALRCLAEAETPFDLLLLDVELPGMRGDELLQRLRERGCDVPVVFISVIASVEAKVRAFDLGADDYLVKPFSVGELVDRLCTILRRTRRAHLLEFGDLELDLLLRRAHCAGRPLDLAPREFDLLRLLVEKHGQPVPAADLIQHIWAPGAHAENSLRVHASRLKHKLASMSHTRMESERAQSFRLVDCRAQ